MTMNPHLTIEDAAVQRMIRGVRVAAQDATAGFREFAQYMRVRTDQTFSRLRLGGTFRGVTWAYFKPQYTRKDGTVVPAWGGTPRLRAGRSARTASGGFRKRGIGRTTTKGVLGRLRPSGKRVKRGDAIMQDTKTMRNRAALVVRLTGNEMVLGPQGTIYAAAQNRMRRFLFFEVPRDSDKLAKIMAKHIAAGAKRQAGVENRAAELKRLGLPSAFSRIRR